MTIADKLYTDLEKTTAPAITFSKYYCKFYKLSLTKDVTFQFSTISSIYNKDIVYEALLVMFDKYSTVKDTSGAIRLLKTICLNINMRDKLGSASIYPDRTEEVLEKLEKINSD